MTDKTLASLLDDIPDDVQDWLRNRYVPAYHPEAYTVRVLDAVKAHLPEPAYVPAKGDWVKINGDPVPQLVVAANDEFVWTAVDWDEPEPWPIDANTFHPAERPEVTP